MLEKVKYDEIAAKLENDLNERFTRIHWKVDDYNKRLEYATISCKWWEQHRLKQSEGLTITMTPEEVFKDSMGSFRINFSIRINERRLVGDTEMDGRLITDPSTDATSVIAEMVAGEIAAELLIE